MTTTKDIEEIFLGKEVKKTMKASINKGFVLYPEGEHIVTILNVSEQVNQFWKDGDPEIKKKRWEWTLEMSDGISTIRFFTGVTVGNKKANLTKLYAAVLGKKVADLTDEELKDFDTDDLIGKEVKIKIVNKEDEEGQEWNRIETVKPVKGNKKDKMPF